MELNFQISEHFVNYINLPRDSFEKYLHIGAYGSGKSYAVATKLLLRLSAKKEKLAVFMETFSKHQTTTYSLFKELTEGIRTNKVLGKMTTNIYLPNGSEIIFLGAADPEALKSLHGITIAFIEELSQLSRDSYSEILGRLRAGNIELHMATNPTPHSHWIYEMFFTLNGISEDMLIKNHIVTVGNLYIQHSTVKHNPFVSQSYVDRLYEYRLTDPYRFQVGVLGRFATLGDRVITNYKVEEFDPLNAYGNVLYGLDLGFSVSYNACIRCVQKGRKLYITHEYYSKELTDKQLADDLFQWSIANNFELGTVWSDHEPSTIRQLNIERIQATQAEKLGKIEGFKRIRNFELIVHPNCRQVISDLELLQYKEVRGIKREDVFTIDPHTIDAISYALSYTTITDYKGSNYKKTLPVKAKKFPVYGGSVQ